MGVRSEGSGRVGRGVEGSLDLEGRRGLGGEMGVFARVREEMFDTL